MNPLNVPAGSFLESLTQNFPGKPSPRSRTSYSLPDPKASDLQFDSSSKAAEARQLFLSQGLGVIHEGEAALLLADGPAQGQPLRFLDEAHNELGRGAQLDLSHFKQGFHRLQAEVEFGDERKLSFDFSLQVESAKQLQIQSAPGEFQAVSGQVDRMVLDLTVGGDDGQSFAFHIEVERRVVGAIRVEGEVSSGDGGLGQILDRLPDDVRARVESFIGQSESSLQALFSPENTARRIVDFALSGFQGNRDHLDQRRDFRDFILPYVDQGYQQARDILGPLPEAVDQELSETRHLIDQYFDDFVVGNEKLESDEEEGLDSELPGLDQAA